MLLLLLLVLLVLFVCQWDAVSDRAALMVLFAQCGGAQWLRKANWGSEEALSTWEGVKVDEEGRVMTLHLAGKNLTGAAPTWPVYHLRPPYLLQ